jgi:hypothetical protein
MRRLLIIMGIAMTALEVVNAPMLEFWPAAVVFAAMFAGFTVWFVRRGTRPPVVVLAGLFLMELVFLPGFARVTALDWLMQGLTFVLCAVGLVAAVGTLAASRRSRAGLAVAPS